MQHVSAAALRCLMTDACIADMHAGFGVPQPNATGAPELLPDWF